MSPYLSYIIAAITLILTALLPSSAMKSTNSPWYDCIKPSITPPKIVFPIVWTILYVLIAIALAETLKLEKQKVLLLAFAINLTLNILWSFAYFGWKSPKLSLIIILLLWLSTVYLVVKTFQVHPKWVGFILLPYLMWITFATVLNGLSLNKLC